MNKDFALIDANFARAREGFRVLDESARFVLCDHKIFEIIKQLRHRLVGIEERIGLHFLSAQEGNDVGETVIGENNHRRSSLYDIIRANSRRVTESLRVLEEVLKIYRPEIIRECSTMRYRVYEAEAALARQTPHYYLHRYCARGIVYPLAETVEEIIWLVTHGARLVQLRDKTSNKIEIETKIQRLCRAISEINTLREDKVLLIINDYPELAAKYPVAGVHVGQEDGNISAVRQLVGSNKIIGRSNHSLAQVRQSVAAGADYISIGPVYATPTKAERPPVGLELVRQVALESSIPWLAIGGIDEKTIHEVRAAGAKNVAVVRSGRKFFS